MNQRSALLATLLGAVLSGSLAILPASAHAGFLLPVSGDNDASGRVVLIASFSDNFPEVDIALTSDHWALTAPDGSPAPLGRIAETSQQTVVEALLPADGTWRLSTGERLGRLGEVALTGGEYVRLGGDGPTRETLPEDASVLTSQTATVSDLYLTRGAATDGVLGRPNGRLAIVPDANPTGLGAGDTLVVTILFDGEPLDDAPLSIFTPSNSGKEGADDTSLLTGADGKVTVDLASPGPHLLMIRHIAAAPEGAATDVRSYTSALTLIAE